LASSAASFRRVQTIYAEGNMAVRATPETQIPYDPYATSGGYPLVEERGYGWVMFAGTLLLMLGTLQFIEGIAAIGNAHFFAGNTHYIAGSLNTWGWVVLWIGVAEWCVGVGIFAKNQFSRWVGVFVLGLNAIVQLMMIPAYPFWSLSIFTLDILAIFGLVAYGARISSADR
jgi:hypothetical protein